MKYAQTGINSFSGVEGCPGHAEKADPNDSHFSVNCIRCDPFLAKDPLWSGTPSEVPLTDREQKTSEAAKSTFDAVAAQSVAALAAQLMGNGLNVAQVASAVAPGAQLSAGPAAAPAKKTARARKSVAAKTSG
jgi:hypothetical protein